MEGLNIRYGVCGVLFCKTICVSICQELQTGTWRSTIYLEAHGTSS